MSRRRRGRVERGVGVVVYQIEKDRTIRYIAFASKTLREGQRNYPAAKRELLAIVFSLKRYRHLFWAVAFIVECDQKALSYIQAEQ